MSLGLREIGQGSVCEGAESVREGRVMVETASHSMGDVLLHQREDLQRRVSPDDPDADAFEVQFHELGYRSGLVGNALIATRRLDETIQTVCDQVVGPLNHPGFVASTDEAAGTVQMRNGRVFALADIAGRAPVYEGAKVLMEGLRFKDTNGVVRKIRPLGEKKFDLSVLDSPVFIQCVSLRIAPFQPFTPPLPGPNNYVLHHPLGYVSTAGFFSGNLVLERPMRLAAHDGACPTGGEGTGKQSLQTYRYSLKLEFKRPGESTFTEFVSDLDPSDNPVPFPGNALPNSSNPVTSGTLRVTEQGQSCIGKAPKQHCSSTVNVLSPPQEYPVIFFLRGALGSAGYAKRLFDLEDYDNTGFRVGVVTSVTTHPILSGLPVTFQAEGFSASGFNTTHIVTNFGNPFFAIRQQDFFDPDQVASLAAEGTSQRSGLRWPRVIGTRSGHPFWYSATLPNIIRDLVDKCNPGPDSYYRLPWKDGAQVGVGQGNNGAASHSGSQAFAFDVSMVDAQTIRAIRGGTVDWFQEVQTASYNPFQPIGPGNIPFPNGSLQNWGNAVRIRHQDGTFAWYFHIRTNGVLVNQGQTVQRGQPIALADNTGRTGGPHLHFQVQADNINWGQSIQIRFDTNNEGQCYIPQTGDPLISNNANPNYPFDILL